MPAAVRERERVGRVELLADRDLQARALARRSEELGYDLTLIAELFLNDIKGIAAPSQDAWTLASAVAAVTERLELMIAVRPSFHNPAIFAKQAACLDPRRGAQYSGFDFLELTVDGLVVFLPAAYLAQLLAERVAVAVKAVG